MLNIKVLLLVIATLLSTSIFAENSGVEQKEINYDKAWLEMKMEDEKVFESVRLKSKYILDQIEIIKSDIIKNKTTKGVDIKIDDLNVYLKEFQVELKKLRIIEKRINARNHNGVDVLKYNHNVLMKIFVPS
jgi:hypothetical protein